MMKDNTLRDFFVHVPYTIIGMGRSAEVASLVGERGGQSVAVITDANIVAAGLVDKVKLSLEKGGYRFGIYDACRVHAPSGTVEACSEFVRSGNYDLLVGVGGGSIMDTVKAVSVIVPNRMSFSDLVKGQEIKRALPKIMVPTTAGTGSEWSRIGVYYDEAENEEKMVVHNRFFADAVVLDPELTLGMPQRVTVDSATDALTHAIEAYTCATPNRVSDGFAESAIELITENLGLVYPKGNRQPEARYHIAIAASMAMGAVAMSGGGMAHFLNPQIVKRAHIPHGEACMLLLPHTMDFIVAACPARFAKIASLMGEKTEGIPVAEAAKMAIAAVRKISRDMGIPQKLSEVGIRESDISAMATATWEAFQGLMERKIRRRVTFEDVVKIYTSAL